MKVKAVSSQLSQMGISAPMDILTGWMGCYFLTIHIRRFCMSSILWSRLRDIASRNVGKNVQLFATTEMDNNLRAVVKSQLDTTEIILNLSMNKTIGQVIKSLAHELAHVKLGNNEHNNPFKEEWGRLVGAITEEYNK
jgi:hypothetical protein